ncbi:protein MRG1 isoform X1 [Vitis riparia]|uniref:protein MRG1 isoform X1 n=1 Tax=Vitis riparia TaxID=96939 RepID=UPI00155A6E7D|nr:protein MRG1 isoform X1 [Vitis riparia]XP_034689467.1 protein MRG1 isoform X1 [Vitis riparia]
MGSSNTGVKDDSTTDADTSTGDIPASNSGTFSEGEKVLAYHGPRIYEAKVQKAEFRKKEWRYFVHYLGWNKNWDEWVGMDRLMKHTEENILKQQALDKKQGAEKNPKSGRSAQAKPKSSTDAKVEKEDLKSYDGNGYPIKDTLVKSGDIDTNERELKVYSRQKKGPSNVVSQEPCPSSVARGKRRKSDSGIEKDNASTEKLVKIPIPATLKKQLVDDWDFVTQQDKLVKLPRIPNVDAILIKYLEYRIKKDGTMTDYVAEILNGLRSYFDRALPMMLLYKKERQQFQEAIYHPDLSPSTVYGAEHLLRLFVKLPELLACVNIEEETLIGMQQKFIDFLKFLQKNQSTFFLSAYEGSKSSEGSGRGKG